MSMITEICAEVNNWFTKNQDKIFGNFSVENGKLTPPVDLINNQYYRIVDSVFNDGVHKYTEPQLPFSEMINAPEGDETEPTEQEEQPEIEQLVDEPPFDGAVWKMRVPHDFLQLVADIEAWQEKNGSVDGENMSPLQSESLEGYSYSKGSGSSASGAGATAVSWQAQFKSRLNKYRRIRGV